MKTAFRIPAWPGIISLVVALSVSCNLSKPRTELVKDELAEFCKQTNAAPAFADLPSRDLLTIDLQRSLFVKGRRVAFRGRLSDLYRSEKLGALMAYFDVKHGDSEIGIGLRCSESQLQQLHDDYRNDKNTAFMIAAEFDEVEPFTFVSGTGVKTPLLANENVYSVTGTLVSCLKSAIKEPARESSSYDSD